MRRTGGSFDVAARAGTGIDQFALAQANQGVFIERQPLRLDDWLSVPVEAEPAQVFEGLFGGAGFDARRVNVLDAQDKSAILGTRAKPGDEVSAGVADMLGTGGRG